MQIYRILINWVFAIFFLFYWNKTIIYTIMLFFVLAFLCFFFFFSFLGLHLWHMEVPRKEVKLELHLLAYTTATATQNRSCVCKLHHSLWQRQILNPQSKARDQRVSSWILVGFLINWATMAFFVYLISIH